MITTQDLQLAFRIYVGIDHREPIGRVIDKGNIINPLDTLAVIIPQSILDTSRNHVRQSQRQEQFLYPQMLEPSTYAWSVNVVRGINKVSAWTNEARDLSENQLSISIVDTIYPIEREH